MEQKTRISDADIEKRMNALDEAGFPPEETVRTAEALAHHAWGDRAEEALERVIVELPRDRLNLLVSRHVMAQPDSKLDQDYTGRHHEAVRRKIEDLGVPLHDAGDEWTSHLQTGTKLTLGYGSEESGEPIDSRGQSLCRIALYSVWLRTMRNREADEDV